MTMKYSITFLEPQYEELLLGIFAKEGLEGEAYLLCGNSRTEEEERLLVREVIPVKDEHYLKRAPLQLSIGSDSFVPLAKRSLMSLFSLCTHTRAGCPIFPSR